MVQGYTFPILIETLGVSPFSFPRSHSLSLLPRCNCAHLTSATTTQSAHGANSPPFLLIFSEFGVWRVAGETFGVAHPTVDKAHDADKNPEREPEEYGHWVCVQLTEMVAAQRDSFHPNDSAENEVPCVFVCSLFFASFILLLSFFLFFRVMFLSLSLSPPLPNVVATLCRHVIIIIYFERDAWNLVLDSCCFLKSVPLASRSIGALGFGLFYNKSKCLIGLSASIK